MINTCSTDINFVINSLSIDLHFQHTSKVSHILWSEKNFNLRLLIGTKFKQVRINCYLTLIVRFNVNFASLVAQVLKSYGFSNLFSSLDISNNGFNSVPKVN
jgi:hypothetical protein